MSRHDGTHPMGRIVSGEPSIPERIAAEIESLLDNSEGDDVVRECARIARGFAPLAPALADVVDVERPLRDAVLRIHHRLRHQLRPTGYDRICAGCLDDWPCATARAAGVTE